VIKPIEIYIYLQKFLLTLLSLVVSEGLKTDWDLSSEINSSLNVKNYRLARFVL
jgi:hypothetical protein